MLDFSRALDNLRAWDTSRPSRTASDDSLDTVSQASSQSTEIWWSQRLWTYIFLILFYNNAIQVQWNPCQHLWVEQPAMKAWTPLAKPALNLLRYGEDSDWFFLLISDELWKCQVCKCNGTLLDIFELILISSVLNWLDPPFCGCSALVKKPVYILQKCLKICHLCVLFSPYVFHLGKLLQILVG